MNIRLEYSLTTDDYYEFQMAYLKNRKSLVPKSARGWRSPLRIIWGIALLLFVVTAIIANAFSPGTPPAAVSPPNSPDTFLTFLPYIVLIAVLWAFFYWAGRSRFTYRRIARQSAELDVPQRVEATDSHLKMEQPGCSSLMEWTYFIRVIETKSTFLLFILPRMAHILPKRAFASSQDLQEFRDWVSAHVGNQVIGFPVQRHTAPAT